jgi:hypothetical protein
MVRPQKNRVMFVTLPSTVPGEPPTVVQTPVHHDCPEEHEQGGLPCPSRKECQYIHLVLSNYLVLDAEEMERNWKKFRGWMKLIDAASRKAHGMPRRPYPGPSKARETGPSINTTTSTVTTTSTTITLPLLPSLAPPLVDLIKDEEILDEDSEDDMSVAFLRKAIHMRPTLNDDLFIEEAEEFVPDDSDSDSDDDHRCGDDSDNAVTDVDEQ